MTSDSRRPADAEPQRIGALATLPLFHDLNGRRALVAELLAAAGARVAVLAPEPGPEIIALAGRGAAAGAVILQRCSWHDADLVGLAVAVCDAEDDDDAAAFRAACRAAGVPCNVIDKPAFCDFIFGSIVNRSPVVVGISTDGAAPILGQAIRTRIEALLPRSLAEWAAVAKELRSEIAARLESAILRRRFWDRASQLAFTRKPRGGMGSELRKLAAAVSLEAHPKSRVTMIEVGSDPEDLTLKSVRALQSADIILFDVSVSPQVLELARREAKRVPVGAGDRDSHARIARLATLDRHVVLLRSAELADSAAAHPGNVKHGELFQGLHS
jgi:uroporphyrin-III C-methyltransferase/precorrin-2 dehydrogenase/sirohydrochlorin ferrochelatase